MIPLGERRRMDDQRKLTRQPGFTSLLWRGHTGPQRFRKSLRDPILITRPGQILRQVNFDEALQPFFDVANLECHSCFPIAPTYQLYESVRNIAMPFDDLVCQCYD